MSHTKKFLACLLNVIKFNVVKHRTVKINEYFSEMVNILLMLLKCQKGNQNCLCKPKFIVFGKILLFECLEHSVV